MSGGREFLTLRFTFPLALSVTVRGLRGLSVIDCLSFPWRSAQNSMTKNKNCSGKSCLPEFWYTNNIELIQE